MLELNEQQVKHLLETDGRSRYEFSIKKIVDWEEAWGLYNDGWIMFEDSKGNMVFPIWPAKDFVEHYIKQTNKNCVPKEIFLDNLMDDLLPDLDDDNIGVGVFDIPEREDTSVVKAKDFLRDLEYECSKY